MPGMRKTDEQSQENDQREEDYQKLMPKIGRDFVTRDDLADILASIVNAVPGLSVKVGNSKAIALAAEYKKNIEEGGGKKKYKDLVEIDEEQKEEEEETEEEEDEEGTDEEI
jgi:hypothetical protein